MTVPGQRAATSPLPGHRRRRGAHRHLRCCRGLTAVRLGPGAAAVTLLGRTLSNAACICITCAFALVFLLLAVSGFGKPD
jgi:hypothetical protein